MSVLLLFQISCGDKHPADFCKQRDVSKEEVFEELLALEPLDTSDGKEDLKEYLKYFKELESQCSKDTDFNSKFSFYKDLAKHYKVSE